MKNDDDDNDYENDNMKKIKLIKTNSEKCCTRQSYDSLDGDDDCGAETTIIYLFNRFLHNTIIKAIKGQ